MRFIELMRRVINRQSSDRFPSSEAMKTRLPLSALYYDRPLFYLPKFLFITFLLVPSRCFSVALFVYHRAARLCFYFRKFSATSTSRIPTFGWAGKQTSMGKHDKICAWTSHGQSCCSTNDSNFFCSVTLASPNLQKSCEGPYNRGILSVKLNFTYRVIESVFSGYPVRQRRYGLRYGEKRVVN